MSDQKKKVNPKAEKEATTLEKAKLSVTKPPTQKKETTVKKETTAKNSDPQKQLKVEIKRLKAERDEVNEQIKAELGETLGKKGQLRDLRVKELEALREAINTKTRREIMELEKKAGLEVDEDKLHKLKIKEIENERKAANAKAKRELVGMGVDYAVKKPPVKKSAGDAAIGVPSPQPSQLSPEQTPIQPQHIVINMVAPTPQTEVAATQTIDTSNLLTKDDLDKIVQKEQVPLPDNLVTKEVLEKYFAESKYVNSDDTLTKMLEKIKREIYLISKDLDEAEARAGK
ncbi:MAG: hypothetical protein FWE22_08390 [Firmicutes bacterium]|nr:hypothetical protein [Bacillota bacterium]